MEESKEGRKGGTGRKRRRKRAWKAEEPEASSDPRFPRRTPRHPFSLTSSAHSSLHYSTRRLKTLFAPSPSFPLHLSHTFDLVSRTPSLSTSCFDFIYIAKWGYFASTCDNRARNSKTIVNLLPKLIYILLFDVFYLEKNA